MKIPKKYPWIKLWRFGRAGIRIVQILDHKKLKPNCRFVFELVGLYRFTRTIDIYFIFSFKVREVVVGTGNWSVETEHGVERGGGETQG